MKETGIRIKEMRSAAGMSQTALAAAAECVTASEISKAERGIKELTPEQLEAVAKALGVTAESLLESAPAAEEVPADIPVMLTAEEREWLDLYRAADADKRQLALCILKGTPGSRDFEMIINSVLKSIEPAELIGIAKNMILGANVGDLLQFAKSMLAGKDGKGLMSALKSMSGSGSAGAANGSRADGPAMETGGNGNENRKEISTPFLTFTYFYSVSIYILLLSFYFWLWRTDIRPEKW